MKFLTLLFGVAAIVVFLTVGLPVGSLGQGATGLLPKYKIVVPALPSLPNPPPGAIPGPPPPEWGAPQAPGVDHYYLDGKPDQWWPDEFFSNPDPSIDITDLKGYHFPPFLRWLTVDKRIVKAGESIKFEALIEDPSEVPQMMLQFEGPQGRRTELLYYFQHRKDNPMLFEGEIKTSKWAEPGRYLIIQSVLTSSLGHAKAYFPEYVPALKDFVFEVLPNPDADVLPPTLQNFGIGRPGQSTAEGVAQAYDIKDSIMVWAKLTDNKSGVASVTVRILSAHEKFKEINLQPWMGKENYWVGYFRIPPHYEGGEYYASSIYSKDNAGMSQRSFYRTNPKLKAARFVVTQDPNMADSNPPELITSWLDKQTGDLGDTIKVSMIVSDDRSGVQNVAADFASYPSFADKRRVHLKRVLPRDVLQKPGFNVDQNLWEATFTTHRLDEPGDWKLVRVFARDGADNLMDIRRSTNPELMTVSVTLTGGVRNMDTPRTLSVTDEPAAVQPTPGTGKVRRVDMTPPHPPRGACLNCHEP